MLNPCNVVAQLVRSQPITVDTTVTFFSHSGVLGPSRFTRKELASSIVHSALVVQRIGFIRDWKMKNKGKNEKMTTFFFF